MASSCAACSAVSAKQLHSAKDAFDEYWAELGWLALFLTGDEQLAEVCLLDASAMVTVDDVDEPARIARRAIVYSAIEIQRSRLAQLSIAYEKRRCPHASHAALSRQGIQDLVEESELLENELDALCRFSLVVRGVEDYSATDSARLLGISRTSLEAAYCAALQSLDSFGYQREAQLHQGLHAWS